MIYLILAVLILQCIELGVLIWDRLDDRKHERQAALPPVVKAVPLHPDALRVKALKEK